MPMTDSTSSPPGGSGAFTAKRPVAVALRYDQAVDELPVVTASGRGALAEEILQIAFALGVPVRKDADLAEVLAAIEVETPIPVSAFAAVAEILSYVYRANRKLAG